MWSWRVSQEPAVRAVCGLGKSWQEGNQGLWLSPWGSWPSQKRIITVIITLFGEKPLNGTAHLASSSTNISLYCASDYVQAQQATPTLILEGKTSVLYATAYRANPQNRHWMSGWQIVSLYKTNSSLLFITSLHSAVVVQFKIQGIQSFWCFCACFSLHLYAFESPKNYSVSIF